MPDDDYDDDDDDFDDDGDCIHSHQGASILNVEPQTKKKTSFLKCVYKILVVKEMATGHI